MGHSFTKTTNNGQNLTGTGTISGQCDKRLLHEWSFLTENPMVREYFRCETLEQDVVFEQDKFCIYGYLLPQKEPYGNAEFKVRITLPAAFPYKPPIIQLLSFIYHPGIHSDISKPEFCCNCWPSTTKPGIYIYQIIKDYVELIENPDIFSKHCDYNSEARKLCFEDKIKFDEKARAMAARYPRRA